MTVVKYFALVTLPSLLLCFVFGEVFFRYVIPASKQPWGYYHPIEKVARFETGQGSGIYTIGRFAQQRGKWSINNAGWNSPIDYFPRSERKKPLIAIVGDSYIEALQVDIKDSITSILGEKVREQYDTYGFGKSGATLSQYLQMVRYINDFFKPDIIIVNVVHNDFDEILSSKGNDPYFLSIGVDESGAKESILPTFIITARRSTKIIFKSAIFRYLWHNVSVGAFMVKKRPKKSEFNLIKYQKEGSLKEVDEPEVYKAVRYVIKKMRDENINKELIFMIDAPRHDIYAGKIHLSKVEWMNKMLEGLCQQYNLRFIDLTNPFRKLFEENQRRFNSEYDYHWDEYGHRQAAEILYKSLIKFGILKSQALGAESRS
jgi:hypothetical protein